LTENDQALWRKSSFSGNGDCLELLVCTDGVRVRDSKRPDGVQLRLSFVQWATFLAKVRTGELDKPHEGR
jgi:Domain of unknown function (DUF397)